MPEGESHFKLTKTLKLPIKWMSIEAMDERVFSEKSDVWACGVTMWEVLRRDCTCTLPVVMPHSYGAIPFDKVGNLDVQARVREGQRLERPAECPPDMYALMSQCWLSKPDTRPSFLQLRTELVRFAAAQPAQAMRDVGATLAKAKSGAETVYVALNGPDRDFDESIAIESMCAAHASRNAADPMQALV